MSLPTRNEQFQRIGIIGYPVGHTLSPLMHNSAFQYLALPYQYEALETDPARLQSSIQEYVAQGFVGFNVTIPFKEAILPFLHHLSDDAKTIGAVNTILVKENKLYGYNTDAIGIKETLGTYREAISQSNVLILGAGGAARSMVYVLANYFRPLSITVAARNAQRALTLASLIPDQSPIQFKHIFFTDEEIRFSTITSKIIINTTPIGMHPNIDNSPLPNDTLITSKHIVYDVIYRPLKTKLLKQAEQAGAITLGGLPMLIYQGAAAFKIWTGKEMPIQYISQILKQKLEAEA